MFKTGIALLLAGGLLGLLAACSAPPSPVSTNTVGVPTSTVISPPATPTSLPPTVTPTPMPLTGLTDIHMFSETGGWALAARPDATSQLLHTGDGGQTWTDVSPAGLPADVLSASFLDASSAWVFDYNTPSNGLAHTQDGGQTWTMLPPLPVPQDFSGAQITFIDLKNGWFETGSPGAGSADIGFFTTHDGGMSWSQVQLNAPPDQPDMSLGLIPGTLHLCMMCRTGIYYDLNRVMIVYGDLNSPGIPSGVLPVSISMDSGSTWKNLQLAFPSAGLASENVLPMLPVFFDQQEGLLTYGFVKYDAALNIGSTQLVFYATHDGGLTWKPFANSVVQNVDVLKSQNVVDFVSPQVAFVPCGNDLCATQDGGQTWQTLKSNLNFVPASGNEYVRLVDFISSTTGWAITTDGTNGVLWKTTDGGATWDKLSLVVLP